MGAFVPGMRATALLCLLSLAGCGGDYVGGGADGGGVSDSTMPTGVAYRPQIQSDLDRLVCTSAPCHGSALVPMQVRARPTAEADWEGNYDEVKARAGIVGDSMLIKKAKGFGGHRVDLRDGDPEITRWEQWVAAGTPYQQAAPPPDAMMMPDAPDAMIGATDAAPDGMVATYTWNADVGPLMNTNCTSCHGTMGSYSLESYGAAFGNGTDGTPNVIAGDTNCELVQYVHIAHPGVNADVTAKVHAWVAAGAPQN